MTESRRHPVGLVMTGILTIIAAVVLALSLTFGQVVRESISGTEIVSQFSDKLFQSLLPASVTQYMADTDSLKASVQADPHAKKAVSMLVDNALDSLAQGSQYTDCDVSGELDGTVDDLCSQLEKSNALSGQELSFVQQTMKDQTKDASAELNRYAAHAVNGMSVEGTPVGKALAFYRAFTSTASRLILCAAILLLVLRTFRLVQRRNTALYFTGAEAVLSGILLVKAVGGGLSAVVMNLTNTYLQYAVLLEQGPFERAGRYLCAGGIVLIAAGVLVTVLPHLSGLRLPKLPEIHLPEKRKNKHFRK